MPKVATARSRTNPCGPEYGEPPTLSLTTLEKGRSVAEESSPLLLPGALIWDGESVEIARSSVRIVDPLAQQLGAVDHVDRELVEHIFVGEVAPQRIVRVKPADRLERERLQPPRLERLMAVERALSVDENTAAHFADMLVEGRLKGDVAQLAAGEPLGREFLHLGHDFQRLEVGRAEQFERAGGSPAL